MTQRAVDEIHKAWKTDYVLTVYYRGKGSGYLKRKHYMSDVCRLLGVLDGVGMSLGRAGKLLLQAKRGDALAPIDHDYAPEFVGKTVLRDPEDVPEEPVRGCVDD